MTPALEYLIRTELIKEWLTVPCSLFLLHDEDDQKKMVVTINEEFKPSNHYSVKHWKIGLCSPEQALPFMNEFRIAKDMVFNHPAVVLEGYDLLRYQQESIASYHNTYRQPMSPELYGHYYEHTTDSLLHTKKRTNWLWSQFVHIYAPDLSAYSHYISSMFRSEASLADEQRDLVCKYMKKQWRYWLMWQKHLLLSPGELIFYKEYSERINN
jgi:hypothetical protein